MLASDIRCALRRLRANALAMATLTLALSIAIAGPVTVFAVADGLLFQRLPFKTPAQLMIVQSSVANPKGTPSPVVAWRDVAAWRDALSGLRATAYTATSEPFYRSPDERLWSASVDEYFFEVLGIHPQLGGFSAEHFDWVVGADQVEVLWPAMISDGLWSRMFGRDRAVVGRVVPVSSRQGRLFGIRVVGVLPQGFVYPANLVTPEPEVIVPIPRSQRRGTAGRLHYLTRVSSGSPVGAALARSFALVSQEARMAEGIGTAGRSGRNELRTAAEASAELLPLNEVVGAASRPAVSGVAAAAVTFFVLALASVCSVWAVHLGRHSEELALRRLLGANYREVVRVHWIQAALLCTSALGAALVLAHWLLGTTLSLLPPDLALLGRPAIDGRALFAAATLATLAAVSVAGAVSWAALRRLRQGISLRSASVLSRWRSGTAVVGVQAALIAALGGLGLGAAKGWVGAWYSPAGFDSAAVAIVEAHADGYLTLEEGTQQLSRAFQRLLQLPGLEVAASSKQPMFERDLEPSGTLVPEGQTEPFREIGVRAVTWHYFETLRIPWSLGEQPNAENWRDSDRVAVVSESTARRFWPEGSPLGRRLRSTLRGQESLTYRVIGVVGDVRYRSLDAEAASAIYVPGLFVGGHTSMLVVTRADSLRKPLDYVIDVLAAEGLRVDRAESARSAMFTALRHRALPAWLFGFLAFAGTAVFCLSVFSAARSIVQGRRREVAVRWALGAGVPGLVRVLSGRLVLVAAFGAVVGALVSLVGKTTFSPQLLADHLSLGDVVLSCLVVIILVVTIAIGCTVPSVRGDSFRNLNNQY